eukprot:Hpha_TRINITY_DN13422_c0_g1::TRINITY_DN13422_c0_g1_i10::g.131353::m.131353
MGFRYVSLRNSLSYRQNMNQVQVGSIQGVRLPTKYRTRAHVTEMRKLWYTILHTDIMHRLAGKQVFFLVLDASTVLPGVECLRIRLRFVENASHTDIALGLVAVQGESADGKELLRITKKLLSTFGLSFDQMRLFP